MGYDMYVKILLCLKMIVYFVLPHLKNIYNVLWNGEYFWKMYHSSFILQHLNLWTDYAGRPSLCLPRCWSMVRHGNKTAEISNIFFFFSTPKDAFRHYNFFKYKTQSEIQTRIAETDKPYHNYNHSCYHHSRILFEAKSSVLSHFKIFR